ncbi:MAG: DUF5657 family protein [bacterium]
MEFFKIITSQESTIFLIKTLSITFSFLFLLYSLIMFRQVKIMVKTYRVSREKIIILISFIQAIMAAFLILISLFLI